MRVLILGHGYTGHELAPRLLREGHEVIGTVTEPEAENQKASEIPIETFRLESSDHIIHLLEKHDWLGGEKLSLVFTAGPPRMDENAASLSLLESFLEAIPLDRLRNFIFLSSTSVYGDADGDWVDEDSELEPVSRSGRLKVESESLLRERLPQSVPPVILRPGGIYGPGRNSADRYLDEDYELVGNGDKWVNRIHVVDLARIIKNVIDLEETATLNAVDNNPTRLRELLKFLYEETGRDFEDLNQISWEEAEEKYSEMRLGLLKPSKRVSSDRLIEKYDFEFEYPTVYDGLRELLDSEG